MILMHHHVCPDEEVPPSGGPHPVEGWQHRIRPDEFAVQLESLRRLKFTFVSLDEYVRRAVDSNQGPGRMVALTLDDGWRDNYTYAWPVLARLGVPATFFVVSGPMDGVAAERRMTTRMLRELVAAGMEVGAHTRTHPNLAMLPQARLDDEVGGCKADLEDLLGQPVRFLA